MRVDETRLTAAYMLASRKHGTLYLGSALDLIVRVHEHKEGVGSRFTARYGVTRLVWYQPFMLVTEARDREYEMKKWRRDWKTNLIEHDNPYWDDLYPVLIGAVLTGKQKPFPPPRMNAQHSVRGP
jgi:putative endonuclease